MRKKHLYAWLLLLIGIMIPCILPCQANAAVKISQTKAAVIAGQTLQLKMTGTKAKIKWTSSKKSVATVSNKGLVKGRKKGTANITAQVKKKKYTCKVSVESPSISKKSAVLAVSETLKLSVNGTKQKVKWASSKNSVATVSSTGKVQAKKKGSATITAQIGKKKYTCKLKVEKPVLNTNEVNIPMGSSYELSVKGTDRKITWSSSDPEVATVSKYGDIDALSDGVANITAKIGGAKLVCVVNVSKIRLSQTSLTMLPNEKVTLSVLGTEEEVYWESEDDEIAYVDSDEGLVEAKEIYDDTCESQKTTITATVGECKLKCVVTVENPTISPNDITLLEGQTRQLSIKGTKRKATWSSSRNDIATVSSNGLVTAISEGYATITANFGSMEVDCYLTVDFNSNDAKKAITYSSVPVDNGVIVYAKNNYKKAVNVKFTATYYNSSNSMLGANENTNVCFEPGKTCAVFIYGVWGSNDKYINYSRYEISLNVTKSIYEGCVGAVETTSNIGADNVTAAFKNTSGHAIGDMNVVVVYYDKAGKATGCDYNEFNDINAGSTAYYSFYLPYDDENNKIIPARYELYVNYAFE